MRSKGEWSYVHNEILTRQYDRYRRFIERQSAWVGVDITEALIEAQQAMETIEAEFHRRTSCSWTPVSAQNGGK